MSNNIRQLVIPRGNGNKVSFMAKPHRQEPRGQMGKQLMPGSAGNGSIEDELAKLRAAAAAVQQIRLGAQRELEMAKQMRAAAQRYQQETEITARSQAQRLILKARLATQKDVEELIRNASAEIQKVLADIRVIRITAQEELATQRKFTNAARISTLALAVQKETV